MMNLLDRLHPTRSPFPLPPERSFSRDGLRMSAHDWVGRDDRRHCVEQLASEQLPLPRKPTALIIGQSQWLPSKFLRQDSILLAQVVDRGSLAAIHEAREAEQEELEGCGSGVLAATWCAF